MNITTDAPTIAIYILFYVFEGVINYLFFSDLFERRYKRSKTIFSIIGFMLLADLINVLLNTNMIINTFSYFLFVFLSCVILFKAGWKNALFYSAVSLAVMNATEILAFTTAPNAAGSIGEAADPKFKLYRIIILGTLSKCSYLIALKILSFIITKKKKTNLQANKMNMIIVVVPIFVAFIYTVSFIPFLHEAVLQKYSYLYLISGISMVVATCFIFIYNEHICEQESELSLLKDEKQKNEINQTFYELLEKKNEDNRVLVHDIKHHFAAINSMNNIDDVKKYLESIQGEFDEYQFIGKTSNKMFDLILSKYSHLFEKNNIRFDVEVRTSNLSFIDDNDLVSLLSNLLDNALEASIGSTDAFVKLESKVVNSIDVLSVVNSSSHNPETDGTKLLSTKSDKAFHGFGTRSIERVAKKYNGECEWYFDECKSVFHYNILFNKT